MKFHYKTWYQSPVEKPELFENYCSGKIFESTNPVDFLNLSERTINALIRANILYVKDLILSNKWTNIEKLDITKDMIIDLSGIKGLGRKGINEIYRDLIGAEFINKDFAITKMLGDFSLDGNFDSVNINKQQYDKSLERINVYSDILLLNLSPRGINALKKSDIFIIKDLLLEDIQESVNGDNELLFSRKYLKNSLGIIKGLGTNTVSEIVKRLSNCVLDFNSSYDDKENVLGNLYKELNNLIDTFDERDKTIFKYRSIFSIHNGEKTLEEMGEFANTTGERIRQISVNIDSKIESLIKTLSKGTLKFKLEEYISTNYSIGYGVLDFSSYTTGNVNGLCMAHAVSKLLSPNCFSNYLSIDKKISNILLFYKKGVPDLFAMYFKKVDKFFNEKRIIDRHYLEKDLLEKIIGDKERVDISNRDVYEFGIKEYLKYAYGIIPYSGVYEFLSNKKDLNAYVALILYSIKDNSISSNNLLGKLRQEFPKYERNYGKVNRGLEAYGKSVGEGGYVLSKTKAGKLIKIIEDEISIKPYIGKVETSGSALHRDYSDPRYYILMEKLANDGKYKDSGKWKLKMNDYLYEIYKEGLSFDLAYFLKIFVHSLSKIEIELLKYRLNFVGNYKLISLRKFEEGSGMSFGRMQQFENRLYDTINAVILALSKTELGQKIKEDLKKGEKIRDCKLLDFSEFYDDEINGKFLSYVYKKILSDEYNGLYLSIDGGISPYLLIYSKSKFDENLLNKIFRNVDLLCESTREKTYERDVLIPKIIGDAQLLSTFLSDEGYLYCLNKYLAFKYGIFEYNGMYEFHKIKAPSTNFSQGISLSFTDDDFKRPVYDIDENVYLGQQDCLGENDTKEVNIGEGILDIIDKGIENNEYVPVEESREPKDIKKCIYDFLLENKDEKRDYTIDEIIYELGLQDYDKSYIQSILNELVQNFEIMSTKNVEGADLYGGF